MPALLDRHPLHGQRRGSHRPAGAGPICLTVTPYVLGGLCHAVWQCGGPDTDLAWPWVKDLYARHTDVAADLGEDWDSGDALHEAYGFEDVLLQEHLTVELAAALVASVDRYEQTVPSSPFFDGGLGRIRDTLRGHLPA